MARPLRIEYAGALYHVTARGDRREDIVDDDEDRAAFLTVLTHCVERFNWLVHAYCIMDNHYHLLIETPDGNLSKGMRQLNGVYTQQYNRRHGLSGHLFQGRYKAILVDKDSYLLEVARYIVLNPVRARMVSDARDWRWSSYRATSGNDAAPEWLTTDWILSAFSKRAKTAQRRYGDFVREGVGLPPLGDEISAQMFLGDQAFIDRAIAQVEPSQDLREVPRRQRAGSARPVAWYAQKHTQRDDAIRAAYASGGFSMREVGEHFGLHYSVVSRVISRARNKT